MKTKKKKTIRQVKNERVLFIDFETRSKVNLKDCGTAVYAEDSSTEIILCGYKFSDEKKVNFWWPIEHPKAPKALKDWKGPVVAHFYKFEHHIFKNKYPPHRLKTRIWPE